MAVQKYKCPPITASGEGTFSDNLVGFQLVQGGGLTQGNFEFTVGTAEKVNRTFEIGTFSGPINLKSLGINTIAESKAIFEKNFKVYPNYDLSIVTNFVLYGSMSKRISSSVNIIISQFPAALESNLYGINYTTGTTAFNISYNQFTDETSFELDIKRIRNPFGIDFTTNSTRNLSLLEIPVSELRNMTVEFRKYSLYYFGQGFNVTGMIPTNSLSSGTLKIFVQGNPFSGKTNVYDNLVVRPNDEEVNKVFKNKLDEVQNFLLNRSIKPIYTALFKIPKLSDSGDFFVQNNSITWPLDGFWNLDIVSGSFQNYLQSLNDVSEEFDSYKTNLITRFLTTGAFKEFDTQDHKTEKVLQLYGRSFDETNKFINALAYMNSVHYNTGNDIPSQLLKNLAQTLGWNINISPITNDQFLKSVFGQTNYDESQYSGIPVSSTPDELNYNYYRNLILNSAFLFKSKGTRKSVETLMRLIGAPDALVEFNEFIYLADQRINLGKFSEQYTQISGGTYSQELPVLDPSNVFTIFGVSYTGTTTVTKFSDVNLTFDNFPMDVEGYPEAPVETPNYYFQIGAGWFESTPQHRSPEEVNLTTSVFTGANPNFQTQLVPFSYGQIYLNRFRKFPYMSLGYNLRPIVDNNKSWTNQETGLRVNLDGGINARYLVDNEKLVLNVKNVDLFLNPSQGLAYDVWYMSRQYNYPIPYQGLRYVPPTKCNPYPNSGYPERGGVDWTEINPKPQQKTFFEFAQTFWQNMINVRNRQYVTDGKTSGYPTLQSIYWKYLESQQTINIPNDNFTYKTMIDYVVGMGDYWIRLVEQMFPATTLWNTGVKYENSIFHRQKFVYRRQEGCKLVAVPCKPCKLTTNIYDTDCPIQSVECYKYPWNVDSQIQSFGGVLGSLLTDYLTSIGLTTNNCVLNSTQSEWYVDIRFDGTPVVTQLFFNGLGYDTPGISTPSQIDWDVALSLALDSLSSLGYSYYLTSEDTIIIFNNDCGSSLESIDFTLNVGINFNILCN
jgi:hypothetical protein